MAIKKTEKEKEPVAVGSASILGDVLKKNSKDHYNDVVEVPESKVSSGSLLLDSQLGGGFGTGGLIRLVGFTEGGKEQPISEPVLTPNGWVPIGELKVGDKVFDAEGKEQDVLAIYPQGIKDVYEVEFEDGSKTRCGKEHLWETSSAIERYAKNKKRSSVKKLCDIEKSLRYGPRYNHTVRIVKPIQFIEKKFPLNPYLLGILLGDGGLTEGVTLTSADEAIWSRVELILGEEHPSISLTDREPITKYFRSNNTQNKNELKNTIRDLGLLGLKSEYKFIPNDYKFGSISQRLSLLQGLVDTDGYLNDKKSEVIYYTVSDRLADDVLELVRSLGGIARKRFKIGSYKKDGIKVICKKCWIITFHLPADMPPCSLTRKLERWKPRIENFCHFIKAVTLLGKEESICIKVSSLDSLYVTKDYILTHNTSESLEIGRNFLLTVAKSKMLYVKAEGRLSKDMQERSGLKFVWKAEEWVEGTCFVLETNIYDIVIDLMRRLISDNPNGERFCFLLDSMDGLILRSDMEKEIGEAGKVAGAPMLTKKFMQRLSNAMNKLGHLCIMIGQVSAKVEIDPYAPKDSRQISATGGNAAMHFSNTILQFEPRNKGDIILEDDKAAPHPVTNKLLGHWCKVIFKKTTNEKSNMIVRYPIKYGRKGGNSIWKEYEIVDILLMYQLIVAKGAWVTIDSKLVEEAKDAGITLEGLHNGKNQLMTYLEENKEVTNWLFEKLKQAVSVS